jgi:hypothetical protein
MRVFILNSHLSGYFLSKKLSQRVCQVSKRKSGIKGFYMDNLKNSMDPEGFLLILSVLKSYKTFKNTLSVRETKRCWKLGQKTDSNYLLQIGRFGKSRLFDIL